MASDSSHDASRRSAPASFFADVPGADADAHLERAYTLLEILHGNWKTRALCAAVELRVADLLLDGPRSVTELATATEAHAPALARLLRALTTLGVCTEPAEGSFALTPMGGLLASEAPGSLRSWVIWWGEHLDPLWQQLDASIRTGRSGRALRWETEGFEHLQRDPEAAAVFHQALAELTRLTAQSVVQAYDFSAMRRVVDVGGGHGELLSTILAHHPTATGTLFDTPETIASAQGAIEQAGVADRCELVAGDFFESVPGGGDAYLMKTVLHDWDDEQARRILHNCRAAMPRTARLLIIEQVLPDEPTCSRTDQSVVRSDLNMLVALGGGERTHAQFRALLDASGLAVQRVMQAGPFFSIIEAAPTL